MLKHVCVCVGGGGGGGGEGGGGNRIQIIQILLESYISYKTHQSVSVYGSDFKFKFVSQY